MLYIAVIKRLKTLLRFIDTEYYRGIEIATEGLGIALNEVFEILYVADILCSTVFYDYCGFGNTHG